MTLRALLFDVDGTLADTEETHRLAFNAAFRDLDLPFVWEPALYEVLLDVAGGKERLARYFAELDLPTGERERLRGLVPALHQRKTERYAALVAEGGAPLRPGVASLIREAEEAGLVLGIASTTTPANVTALLDAGLGHGASRRFAVVACGDMVAAKKPAPDIYVLALDRLGMSARSAVAFEDSAHGVAAAKAAGLVTVATPTRWTKEQDLRAADVVLPDLADPDLLPRLRRLHDRGSARMRRGSPAC
jgi:HAD superfamily hydrolase (TIGR01509 family)